jgi:hypothetical protein
VTHAVVLKLASADEKGGVGKMVNCRSVERGFEGPLNVLTPTTLLDRNFLVASLFNIASYRDPTNTPAITN